jgi:DNA polymerase elongation subunit (family B)
LPKRRNMPASWLSIQSTAQTGGLRAKLARLTEPANEIGESLLASATYDGDTRKAILKFYDQKVGRFWLWEDNTGHRPYCYSRLSMEELQGIRTRKDVIEIDEVDRLDLLNDTTAKVRKIVTTDPLAIGGGNDSIRDIIRAWEADIKYYENYTYDLGLRMGTYYRVTGGKVIPVKHEAPERVHRSLEEVTKRNPPEFQPYLKEWAELLSEPLADFRRVALDIEVDNEEGRLPDTDDPKQQVIAASFCNDQEKAVFLLKGERDAAGLEGSDFTYEVFDDEADLLRAVFSKMMDYPVIVSFNGDDFDLRYLQHRAERLQIAEDEDPIQLERVAASLKHGIHIDLYQFFRNRSIQVYAFSNKYTEHTLNGIAEALLGKSKIEFEGEVGDLPLAELAKYCLNDSKLTYELTSVSGGVVMKLLLVISRIGKMPMNDVSRLGVSNWIRSMLFFEHRRLGALIPRQDELAEKGGGSTQAVIKGKKYKGGFVVEPKPGAYFDVSVLDFASLYPSLIKVHNLSYETVNCPHPECRSNTIPDTSSWVCTKRSGIVSLVTGSLRDLRVAHYKPLTKDKTLPPEDRELYNVVTQGLKVFLNACFTGDTFLVTPTGVKNVKEVNVGDEVLNVNPETLKVEVDRVVEVQAFPYRGDLYHFKDKRFVDLMVTPNHRFLTLDRRVKSRTHTIFRTAEEVNALTNVVIPKLKGGIDDHPHSHRISLFETAKLVDAYANLYPPPGSRLINWFRKLGPDLRWKIREHGDVCKYWSKGRQRLESHYRVPSRHISEEDIDEVEAAGGSVLVGEFGSTKIPARFAAEDLASLCGWYVSEGSRQTNEPREYLNGNYRGRSASVTISQGFGKGNPRGIEFRREIRNLLDRMGLSSIHDALDNKYYKVTSSILHEWMVTHCYDVSAIEKGASTKRVPRFVFENRATVDAFMAAVYKGDGNRRGIRYSTKSEGLAKDIVVLTSMQGAKAKMNYDGEIFRVVFKNTSSKLTYAGTTRTKNVSRVPFDGTVYCVTTEKNHTVIAGRNGRFVPVGQSYGVLGFETFAFYCLPVAEATAALGRDAITRTIAKSKEIGVDVLYGDSITGERCVTLLNPDGFLRVMPIEEFYSTNSEDFPRSDGKEERRPQGWKTLSMNPMTRRVEFKPITAVIRHRSSKRIFRIREKWGVTRVTEDHSLLLSDGSKDRFAGPLEIGKGHLIRAEPMQSQKQIQEIDVYDVMKHLRYPTAYKGRIKVIEVHCDNDWVWVGWTNRKFRIRIKRHIRVGTPQFRALVELLGAYIPEGSSSTPDTTKSRLGASIANEDTEWLGRMRECYLALFDGAKTTIIRSSKGERQLIYPTLRGQSKTTYEDKTHKLQMMNEVAAFFFKAFAGQGSKGKKIPDFIYSVPTEYQKLLLENMIKGDGSKKFGERYSSEYNAKNFRYETGSNRLVSGLSLLLSLMGIKHTIDYRPSKGTYKITTSSEYNQRRSTPEVTEEAYDGFVYDLSVEQYHTFVDSCGSIVLKNTDSLFLRSPSKDQIATVTRWADTDLGVELDLDKVYRYVAFSSRKKNYFGVLPDGTVDIKGLTGKKSQTPEYLKKVFYETLDILSSVKNPDDFERARTSTKELLTRMISDLKGKKVNVQDLAFTVLMGKPTGRYNGTTPQHVRAAKQLEEKGEEIKAGEIIAYVKTKNPPYVKPAKLARPDEIDADKYIEYAHSMFDQLLDALDFSFDEIMGATTLDLFWSS